MPVSMLVKCTKCGYENFPQHRYCGMCAADLRLPGAGGTEPAPPPLRVPSPAISSPAAPRNAAPDYKPEYREKEAVAPPIKAGAQQLSGPSFLGLGSEPAEEKSFSYLLEDETPRHRGRNLILILLIAAAAGAVWNWKRDLRVVADRLLNTLPAAKSATSEPPQASSPAPPAPDSAGAAPASSAPAPVEQAGAGVQTPAGPAAPSAAPAPAAAAGAAETTQAAQDAAPTDQSGASDAPSKASTAKAATAKAATLKADVPEEAASTPSRASKSDVRAQRETARTDDLEIQGEKYLYGNGVPENCGRARTNLLAAAQQSNAQAESVLGTMYATGHCATRDLPTAYRWFGRSLRQDPRNSRLKQDLRVLWNQMTPDERRKALRNER